MARPSKISYQLIILMANILIWLPACQNVQPSGLLLSYEEIGRLWRADHHAVWAVDWPTAPIANEVVVECWVNRARYRLEILEATPADLIGQTVLFDGEQFYRLNRFENDIRREIQLRSAVRFHGISPISDGFNIVDKLLAQSPTSTHITDQQLIHGLTTRYVFKYGGEDYLIFWTDHAGGEIVRIEFQFQGQQAKLQARLYEPLPYVHEALFTPCLAC